ncbi:MAG TPA: tRNA (adenosine(37)-N6)-threonylcarbamoyltransferase complex dimerization subunit type 1 TsaB [Candidatus Udaeobacter sp.]|nr:tRNA (adenosine(37)-N6)-threonylcarbamoyltransferase complex dimerization subunit type 1 TsaB [Candidatus Udaeobacter sp.]
MKILGLELSTARGGMAWLDEDATDLTREWPNDRKNSALFFENLDEVTRKFGVPDTIIVGLGPGSYAGTRIAISAAIGLQISSGARLIGLPSISAIKCSADEYCVVGDARRHSFFFSRVRSNNLIENPALFSEAELKSKLAALEVATPVFTSDSLPQFERAVVRFPSALVLARLAADPLRSFFLPPLEPIYLREPHITMPK